MKILSFLGPTNYSFTKYRYGDKVVPTRFFAEALPQFFPETEKILVFVTPTVQNHENLEELKSRLGNLLQPVPIPESHTEDALWEIFDSLIGQVEEGERVVFDITNSFRSLPFLVFIAAAFLRSARDVNVEAVVYGAFEARDKDTNISPVFDLTPFVSLFDWLAAANEFIYTGNARYLASQLQKAGQEALAPLADNVTEIARGLELLRPHDVAQATLQLPGSLQSVQKHLPAPFGVVVQPLKETYAKFGVENTGDSKAHLSSQLEMIDWYLEKQHYVHTLSMAREWVVSLLCLHFEADMWDAKDREEVEIWLSGGQRGDRKSIYCHAKNVPEARRLRNLWSNTYKLANLRNDVLHSGFRKNPESAETIIEQTRAIVVEINEIASLWGIFQKS